MLETGEQAWAADNSDTPTFGTVVGVVPTHDPAVSETFNALRRLRNGLVPLVDGDDAGDGKVQQLLASGPLPELVLQWRSGWAMEDAIGWVLKGAEGDPLDDLQRRIDCDFVSIDALVALFKIRAGAGRLKTDYLAYEEVASVIGKDAGCRKRATTLLEAFTRACLGQCDGCVLLERDDDRSNAQCVVLRLTP